MSRIVAVAFCFLALAAGCGGEPASSPVAGDAADTPDVLQVESRGQDGKIAADSRVFETGADVVEVLEVMPDSPIPDANVDLDDISIPDDFPATLPLVWTNLGDGDMVTVRKRIVLEFEAGTPMPETKNEETLYDLTFPATLTLWDAPSGTAGAQVKMTATWRHEQTGKFRRPALVLGPAPCFDEDSPGCPQGAEIPQYLPTTAYRLTVQLGQEPYERVFHTIPGWAPGYKIVEYEVPPQECEECYPYPVKVHVFIPPEYDSDDLELNNTSIPWNNKSQRYPVLVGLFSGYGQDFTKADALSWTSLPRYTAQGVLEPAIIVLPDGDIPWPYCQNPWLEYPVNCDTYFVGLLDEVIPNVITSTCFTHFLAHTMREFLSTRLRVRGWDDAGNETDQDAARRAYGVLGIVNGGWGALLNAFIHPEAWGSVYALNAGMVSLFNPWTYWNPDGDPPVPKEKICPYKLNEEYPLEPVGEGYRDLSMVDEETVGFCPAGQVCSWPRGYCIQEADCLDSACHNDAPCPSTGLTREVSIEQRWIPAGAKSCFWATPPPMSNAILLTYLCGLDSTCRVDPGAPDQWRTDFDDYPFDGNIMFSTGIEDPEGPPAAFIDLDHQLDIREVPHSFLYVDKCGTGHDAEAAEYQMQGTCWPEYPGTGFVYPFFNNAFEGLGNPVFNHPFASEFSRRALDPDEDYVIDLTYDGNPELNYVEDNCPGVYNPSQLDTDGDGIGDECDEE